MFRRLLPTLVALALGFIFLTWGLVALHGVFRAERADGLEAIEVERRALASDAMMGVRRELDTQMEDARRRVRGGVSPRAAVSGVYLRERGRQILPRLAHHAPGSDMPAYDRYELFRRLPADDPAVTGEPEEGGPPPASDREVGQVAGVSEPWTERVRLLRDFQRALIEDRPVDAERAFRRWLLERTRHRVPAEQELPLAIAWLDFFSEQGTPARSTMKRLLRDGLSETDGSIPSLQDELLAERHRFTRPDFEGLAARVAALSAQHGVAHADFQALVRLSVDEPLDVPETLPGPVLLVDEGWYLVPEADGRVVGVAVDLEAVAGRRTEVMRDGGLLGEKDRVVLGRLRGDAVSVAELQAAIASPRWEARAQDLQSRYRLKSALLVLCELLALSLAALAVLAQVRKLRLVTLKSDFVATVSHELRTPLASIRLLAETLQRKLAKDPRARDYPERIVRDIDGLSFLVENILSFSRLDRGRLTPHRQDVELDDVFDVLRHDRNLWARKPVEVEIAGAEGLEMHVDPELLRLMLMNLARNACTHNEREPVQIRVEVERDPVRIRFSDNGKGIPRAEWEQVFGEFVRGRASGESRGSGLGLAICRGIMQVHGGRIRVETSTPEGTTFLLEFPE